MSLFGFLFSFLAFLICFYIPGRYFVSRLKAISGLESVLISIGLGIAAWGLQGWVLGYLGLRSLTYIYLAFFCFFFLKNISQEKKIFILGIKEFLADRVFLVILAIGAVVSLSGVFPSGIAESAGYRFYSVNITDGTYHLALIRSLISNIPPYEPGMAGTVLTNYHYWSDLVLAELIRIFRLPSIELFFLHFPLLLAILYGTAGYCLAKLLTKSKAVGRWFTFFLLLSGGLGFLFTKILLGKALFDIQSLDHSGILFTNLPRALAQALFLVGAICIFKWIKSKSNSWGVVSGVIFGVLVGFKVYVAAFGLIGLGFLTLYFLIKKRYSILVPLLISVALTAVIFFVTNPNTGGIFWSPLSWPRHYFSEGVAAGFNWHLREETLIAGGSVLALTMLRIQMVFAFLVITYGVRLVGLTFLPTFVRKVEKEVIIFFVPAFFIANFLGLFFLQYSGLFEIFNFFAVSALSLSLLTAIWLGSYWRRRQSSYFATAFTLLVILFSAAHPFYFAKEAIQTHSNKGGWNHLFSFNEISFIKRFSEMIEPEALVLVDPRDAVDVYTPYLGAFSDINLYLSGRVILRAHAIKIEGKEQELMESFNNKDPEEFYDFAKSKGIDYVYLTQKPVPEKFYSEKFFSEFDSQTDTTIFKVKWIY